jgi:hypothetical protein
MTIGIAIILAARLLHLFFVFVMGRLPRFIGATLTLADVIFLFSGLVD